MILNLLDRMKLPFRKNKEFLTALYDILGFYPHNIEVYRTAFSHKSLTYRRDAANKDRKGKDRRQRSENTQKPLNNERLEYLGDAVLETVVSDILFRHFPNKREGFLTSTRSKIVQREALNRLATDMGLERLIQAAQGTRMSHTNIGGNAFEALMGAIYLDRGFAYCHWFIANRVVGRYVDLENVAQKEVNFKSKLLEWSQKNRININFRDTAIEGDDKGFKTVIVVEGIIIGRGSGRAKKESQQVASKEALTRMRRDPKVYDNIFRAKEKRTAMEAEESFALPKIDEIEESLRKENPQNATAKNGKIPTLETQSKASSLNESDEAYNTAYDETAEYEVIDTPAAESLLTAADYEAKGIPAPPQENELDVPDEPKPTRRRNRSAKTVNEAVKGFRKNGAQLVPESSTTSTAETNGDKANKKPNAPREQKYQSNAKGNPRTEESATEKTQCISVQKVAVSEAEKPQPVNIATNQPTPIPPKQSDIKVQKQAQQGKKTELELHEKATLQTETTELNAPKEKAEENILQVVQNVIQADSDVETYEATNNKAACETEATQQTATNGLTNLLEAVAQSAAHKEACETTDSMLEVEATETIETLSAPESTPLKECETDAKQVYADELDAPAQPETEEYPTPVADKLTDALPDYAVTALAAYNEQTDNENKEQVDYKPEDASVSNEEGTSTTDFAFSVHFDAPLEKTEADATPMPTHTESQPTADNVAFDTCNESNQGTQIADNEIKSLDKPDEETDFIISKDLTPLQSDESEENKFGNEEHHPESMEADAPKPKLRHLTVDDFIFGLEHEASQDVPTFDDGETDNTFAPKARKHRRRGGRKGRPETPNTSEEDTTAEDTLRHTDTPNQSARRNQPHRSQMVENAVSETTQHSETPKNKRRYRRPGKKTEE